MIRFRGPLYSISHRVASKTRGCLCPLKHPSGDAALSLCHEGIELTQQNHRPGDSGFPLAFSLLENPSSEQESTGQGGAKDAHLDKGVEEFLSVADAHFLRPQHATREAMPIDDEDVT